MRHARKPSNQPDLALASHLSSYNAIALAGRRCRPRAGVPYEPMFDSKQTLTNRLADAVDLAIDFATLGEYGLEPVGSTPRACEADSRVRGAGNQAIARREHLRELYPLTCGPRRSQARARTASASR